MNPRLTSLLLAVATFSPLAQAASLPTMIPSHWKDSVIYHNDFDSQPFTSDIVDLTADKKSNNTRQRVTAAAVSAPEARKKRLLS
jgi:hypothetical protein